MQNILIVKSCDFVYSPMFSCEDVDPAYQQAFIKPNFYFVDDSKLNLKIDISVGKIRQIMILICLLIMKLI